MNLDNNPDSEIQFLQKGNLINDNIINSVAKICKNIIFQSLSSNQDPTQSINNQLKQTFQGEWFVLVTDVSQNGFDFKFSDINSENVTIFSYKGKEIYVCPFLNQNQ